MQDAKLIKDLNLHCDHDLENDHLNFMQNTPAYDNVPSN